MAMIRRAVVSDVFQVAALYHSVWHETQAPFMPQGEIRRRSPDFFADRITTLLQSTLVTEQNQEIVAFAAWRGPILGQLFVATAYRGTGTASSLLSASEIEMAREGITVAELHCVVGNKRARRFYERMGWLHKGQIMEPVMGEVGEIEMPFWRMIKILSACDRGNSPLPRVVRQVVE